MSSSSTSPEESIIKDIDHIGSNLKSLYEGISSNPCIELDFLSSVNCAVKIDVSSVYNNETSLGKIKFRFF